jgi:hypothetical protein
MPEQKRNKHAIAAEEGGREVEQRREKASSCLKNTAEVQVSNFRM